jgi:uncharacterized membrane protein YfcA
MGPLSLLHAAIAFGAAFAAGLINSVAGGGTLVTFPTLVFLGLPPVTANATSTVAIWPGSLGGMWGYRSEMREAETRMLLLIVPSLVGGITGALLLQLTPAPFFKMLVPYLILFATVLFMLNEPVQRWLKRFSSGQPHSAPKWLFWAACFQLLVAIYGGYFGAGIGILMLAALGILGLTDIHQMNGLKNLFALCINGVAAIYFVWAGMVYWPDVVVMVLGAITGGYGGAGIARRIGRGLVRKIVIAIGFGMTLSLLIHR